MDKFVRSLITEWRRLELPFSGECMVVAVSGGADSLALLLAIADLRKRRKLDLRIVVAHFDHGLRGVESREDASFVAGLAGSLGIEFVTARGRVAKTGNIEQNARNARYEFLLKVACKQEAAAVVVAHTRNDQAETFLMNLIRGSGPDGLAAMPPIRRFDDSDIWLVRPLLRWATREDTEAFCKGAGVDYRIDAMNLDRRFSRVRIRRELLPLLKTYNPNIVSTLAGTAGLFSKGKKSRLTHDGVSGAIKTEPLRNMNRLELYNTLREWIWSQRGDLRGVRLCHIEAIEALIHSRKSGKTAELPGSIAVVKGGGCLRLEDI